VEPDTVDGLAAVQRGVADPWYSYLQSLLLFVVMDLVPRIWLLGLLQVALMAGLLAHATALVARRSASRLPVAAFCLVAAVSAPLVTYTIHYTRDTTFAIGLVFLALVVARAAVERRRITPAGLAGVAALTGLLAAYRGEGPVLLLVVPLVLAVALRPARRAALAGAGAFAAAALLFLVVLPAPLALLTEREDEYRMTIRLLPLGAVVQTGFLSEDPGRDLAQIGRVVEVPKLLEQPAALPTVWFQGTWRRDATDADWDAFTSTADRVMLDNLPVVLANRMEVFVASSGLSNLPGPFSGHLDYVTDAWADRTKPFAGNAPPVVAAITAEPPVQRLYTAQEDLLHRTAAHDGLELSGSALHWNVLPWLALLAAALLVGIRRASFAAVVALVVLARVPIVALTAPLAQFKYYNSVHLGGLVVLGLALAAASRWWVRRRRPRPAAPVTDATAANGDPARGAYAVPANASTSAGVPRGTTSSRASFSR